MTSSLAELRARLPGLMTSDRERLRRRIGRAAGLRDDVARERSLREIDAALAQAADRVATRTLAVPSLSYPAELPITAKKDEIAAALRDHQVVVVAGETGSGKTTQLPKICLELGRGVLGQIGHTQPRRIAARAVAARIADELDVEPGTAVGYQVRFADTSGDDTLVKVMTDGILLAELRRDRRLLRYDTLIIDEAHERSLNVDFLLGYLKRLLPTRPDLKVIITSATIDPQRFSAAFWDAPVIEVSGRTYPVEVRYRPLTEPAKYGEPRDQTQGIADAVEELSAEGPGDILVFLSGEREIRDTAEALRESGRGGLDVLPLYARLSAAEQQKVFRPHTSRRVVLATNVAETSLTVPGVRYVVDPGTARVSRYSHRTKVQRLPIEPISQASANQRAGRCGRTADGICIRLYGSGDFAARPPFTDPEILRTHLASVILRMADLDLGEVSDFPFVDPPDARNVADGIRLLSELGALAPVRSRSGRRHPPDAEPAASRPDGVEPAEGAAPGPRLTDVGRKLAALPVDPRLGRMVIEAAAQDCVDDVLVVVAALSIQDPRERPVESRAAADALHARFAEPGSDFLTLLNLWHHLRRQQRELSSSAFRRLCRREFLHYVRVREWQDLHGQLRQAAREIGITARGRRRPPAGEHVEPTPAPGTERPVPEDLARRVHTSLLAGLLSHLGMREVEPKARGARGPAEFAGARGARFAIAPDSTLARKPPRWVVAAELVETSRLWARTAARIEPEWAEPLAAHLVTRSYGEPRWDARRAAAVATEKVTLYGLPIVTARTVGYARVDPAAAREIFISHALVAGEWRTHHRFLRENRRLLADAAELERRARRRGVVADEEQLFAFYDERIPADVVSARHFDAWWKKTRVSRPDLLTLRPADLAGPQAGRVSADDYPGRWGEFPLCYEFAPGEPADGVTVQVPLTGLNRLGGQHVAWPVPGLRHELVTELIRSLPKGLRRQLVPAPDVAAAALDRLDPSGGGPLGADNGRDDRDLLSALSAELRRQRGVTVPRTAWDLDRLPAHLRMRFQVVEDGQVLATGNDLGELRRELHPRLHASLSIAGRDLERSGLRTWDVGDLPRVFDDGRVRAYPALVDAGDAVDVRLLPTEAEARTAMWAGTRRLLLVQVRSGAREAARALPEETKLALSRTPHGSVAALLDDCGACAADDVIADAGGPSWQAEGFSALLATARFTLTATTAEVVAAAARVLVVAQQVEAALDRARGRDATGTGPGYRDALADVRAQVAALVGPGFVAAAGRRRLHDLPRYLTAAARRLDKLPGDPDRDAQRMAVAHRVAVAYREALDELPAAARDRPETREIRWLIEELRVSLFAQTLGTAGAVSEKKILAELGQVAPARAGPRRFRT